MLQLQYTDRRQLGCLLLVPGVIGTAGILHIYQKGIADCSIAKSVTGCGTSNITDLHFQLGLLCF